MRNKTGGIVLKDYLLDVMQRHEQGLYLCELPTGNGKTYDSAHAMKEYADSIVDDTKIIYLTTLNKNLPEDALRAAYGNDDLYNRNVLRLRSNFDEVVEKILDIQVPEEMQTDVYLKLCKDVSLYRNAIEKKYADKEYIKELTDRITDGDRQLRYEITKRLKKRFSTKARRKNAVRTDAKYKWIGKLYPAVFTDDYRIILMSVSKFMKRNSILIDSSYEFLNSDLIENAIIIIDEFDATKDTIQSELIEKSLAMQEDYIQLFRQIYRTLNPNDFSSDMRLAMERVENSENRNTFTSLMAEAREIAEKYHVRLSIKTREDLVDQRQIFLFNDGSFHTVLKEGTQYIRSTLNEEDNRIEVFFEDKEDFFKHRDKEKDIVLYSLLREINLFLLHFRVFSIEWARNYMEIVNDSRSESMDALNLDNAISSILKRLELSNKQRDLLMGETCKMVRNNRELILEDRSFYQVGMEYYEFEDNDSHHDNTNLKFVKVYDTPEKIMLYEMYKKAYDELELMLKNSMSYSEKEWQRRIYEIICVLYPKYIARFREIEVGTDGRHMKTPDFMLVDSAGFVDILEIKKPDGIKVVSTTEYRNNYVASRDLEGAIVQIEKYIYILNHEGEARVKKIQDKVRNHLPSNFRLKVVNPQGILLLGRSNNLTDEQLFDFEIIKRQHKNIVDIMTYDDLLKRFRNILNQIK